MTVIPDAVAALVTYLKNDADVSAAVGERVYGETLPDSFVNANEPMAQTAVLLSTASGAQDYKHMRLNTSRVDVRCYGATPYDAMDVHRRVHPALKTAIQQVEGNTLIHTVDPEISAFSAIEPDSEWPVVFSSWQVLMAEVETSS